MVATYTAATAVGITSIDAYLFPCKSTCIIKAYTLVLSNQTPLVNRHWIPAHRRSLQVHLHSNQRVSRRNRQQQNPRQLPLAGHRTRRC